MILVMYCRPFVTGSRSTVPRSPNKHKLSFWVCRVTPTSTADSSVFDYRSQISTSPRKSSRRRDDILHLHYIDCCSCMGYSLYLYRWLNFGSLYNFIRRELQTTVTELSKGTSALIRYFRTKHLRQRHGKGRPHGSQTSMTSWVDDACSNGQGDYIVHNGVELNPKNYYCRNIH